MKELTMNEMEQVNGGVLLLLAGVALQVAARYTARAGIRYACRSIGFGIFTFEGAVQVGSHRRGK